MNADPILAEVVWRVAKPELDVLSRGTTQYY